MGYRGGVSGCRWREAASLHRNEGDQPLGISQAAPVYGSTKVAPQLWWDNRGGATLQVVEWQRGGSNSAQTWLFFVPDRDNRLQTTTVAHFADAAGAYRWRVWSVGADGTIVLSGWRTMNISTDLR